MHDPAVDRLRAGVPGLVAAIELLVHSNVFISLSAAAVAVTTILLAGFPFRPGPVFIVFAVTLFVYSFNRVTDLAEDEENVPRRAAFTRRYGRPLLGLGVLLYAAAIGLALSWGLPHVEFMLLPVVVGALYSVGRLKRVFLVKNLLVGLSWGVIPLGVGVYYGAVRSIPVYVFFAHVTVMLTLAAVIFDIKDVEGDRAKGISTVPIRYGPGRTRQLCQFGNVLVAAAVVGLVAVGTVPPLFLSLLAFHGYVFAYIIVATPEKGPLFYGFVVDGEHLWLAAVVASAKFVGTKIL